MQLGKVGEGTWVPKTGYARKRSVTWVGLRRVSTRGCSHDWWCGSAGTGSCNLA